MGFCLPFLFSLTQSNWRVLYFIFSSFLRFCIFSFSPLRFTIGPMPSFVVWCHPLPRDQLSFFRLSLSFGQWSSFCFFFYLSRSFDQLKNSLFWHCRSPNDRERMKILRLSRVPEENAKCPHSIISSTRPMDTQWTGAITTANFSSELHLKGDECPGDWAYLHECPPIKRPISAFVASLHANELSI